MKIIANGIAKNAAEIQTIMQAAMQDAVPGANTPWNAAGTEMSDDYLVNGNYITVQVRNHDDAMPSDAPHAHRHSIATTIYTKENVEIGTSVLTFVSLGDYIHDATRVNVEEASKALSNYANLVRAEVPTGERIAYLPFVRELNRALTKELPNERKLAEVIAVRTGMAASHSEVAVEMEVGLNTELMTNNLEFRERLEQMFGFDTTMVVCYYLNKPVHPADEAA